MSSVLLALTMPWFQPIVWMDYRLAVLLTVLLPLILILWAFVQKADAIMRLLVIYWRVASLLAITLYLMIAALPISFVSTILARLLVPASLWFWADLNEEIDDRPSGPLKMIFNSWRWAITVYSTLGAILQLFFVNCAFQSQAQVIDNTSCRVWLDAPWLYKEIFHPRTSVQFLGFLALVGLIVYILYFGYFVLVKFGKQGRSATGH